MSKALEKSKTSAWAGTRLSMFLHRLTELYKTDDFKSHADKLTECQLIADEGYVK